MIDKTDSITPGAGIRLRKKGNFDLNALYKDMRAWFSERDYAFFEKENKKKDSEAGQFVSLKWEAVRNIDDYAQFKIKVQFFIVFLIRVIACSSYSLSNSPPHNTFLEASSITEHTCFPLYLRSSFYHFLIYRKKQV